MAALDSLGRNFPTPGFRFSYSMPGRIPIDGGQRGGQSTDATGLPSGGPVCSALPTRAKCSYENRKASWPEASVVGDEMIDRCINLIVIIILAVACWGFSAKLVDSWSSTPDRDRTWVEREGSEPEYSAEQMRKAMRRASADGNFEAIAQAGEYLEHHYIEDVHTRINRAEFIEIASFFGLCLLPLLLPISLNYIRRGKFSLWNPSAPE